MEIGVPKSQNYPYYDQCHRRDLDFFALLNHRKDIRSIEWKANKTVDCSQWEYNFTQIPYASIAAEVKYLWVRYCVYKICGRHEERIKIREYSYETVVRLTEITSVSRNSNCNPLQNDNTRIIYERQRNKIKINFAYQVTLVNVEMWQMLRFLRNFNRYLLQNNKTRQEMKN